MNTRLALCPLAALLLAAQGPALAQQSLSGTIEPGARLRVTRALGQSRLVGRYVRLRGDSLELVVGSALVPDTQAISMERVTRIEVSQGRRYPVFKTALVGGLLGLLAGGLFGALAPEDPTLGHGGFYYWTSYGTVALWGSIGAGSGVLAGLAVSVLGPERWAPAGIPAARRGAQAASLLGWRIPLRL